MLKVSADLLEYPSDQDFIHVKGEVQPEYWLIRAENLSALDDFWLEHRCVSIQQHSVSDNKDMTSNPLPSSTFL